MNVLESAQEAVSSVKNWFLKLTLIFKIVVVIAVIVIVWVLKSTVFSTQQTTQYQTVKVNRGTLIKTVSASGQVASTNTAAVNVAVSGVVSEVNVSNGQVVEAGTVIAKLKLDQDSQQDQSTSWASYLSAKNNLNSALSTQTSLQSAMFDKWNTFILLAKSGTYENSDGTPNNTNRAAAEFHIAEADWLAAEAKYKDQQVAISQAQAALNAAWLSYQQSSGEIVAPIDGTVTDLTLLPGAIITQSSSSGTDSTTNTNSSQKVASIKTTGKPTVTVNLSEIDAPTVKLGSKVTITLDAFPDKTFTGKVLGIDTSGSASSGVTTYPATIQLDTVAEDIYPNMSASANIIISVKNDVLLVPNGAVQTQNDQSYVQVLRKGQLQQVTVQIGDANDTQTEITSGLKEGDTIVTNTVTGTTTGSSSKTTSPFSSGFGGGGNAVRISR